ncbi:MAG: hypothetical protein K2X03_14205 [Bryobacteraceae bacterium]|nr:hypothetical protein [Bryobacteraceae bacterium]
MVPRRILLLLPFLTSCASEAPKPVEKPKADPVPKPVDETRRFPKAGLVRVSLVEKELLGKDFMPGGNLAEYKRGQQTYRLFLVKTFTPDRAAILLLDLKNRLQNAKFVPTFGGYYGTDAGTPVFAFTKNAYLLGVVGLEEKEADAVARAFAGRVA